MPRGGKRKGAGGKRGQKKGTLQKIDEANVQEQIAAALATAEKMRNARKKLAKEELEDFVPILREVVARFQRRAMRPGEDGRATAGPDQTQFDPGDWKMLKEWMEFYVYTLDALADYQSPKFKAIAVMAPPPSEPAPAERKDNVVQIDDPAALARVYQRRITAAR